MPALYRPLGTADASPTAEAQPYSACWLYSNLVNSTQQCTTVALEYAQVILTARNSLLFSLTARAVGCF